MCGLQEEDMSLADLSVEEIEALPKKVLIELARPAGNGARRAQLRNIIIPLAAFLDSGRMYEVLRSRYESDFTDKELSDLIQWGH
jgi:hypothetical protein